MMILLSIYTSIHLMIYFIQKNVTEFSLPLGTAVNYH